MLNWLAGQKQPEGPSDPDATGYVEPPETPAPVFAVRAFKHALFGTPQTVQPKARRHSNTEHTRPANIDTGARRPNMNRPKSTNDAHTLGKQEQRSEIEPLSSPTKGILLSPGTGTARKKNVTFGHAVVDNEGKRPLRNGSSVEDVEKLALQSSSASEPEGEKKRGNSPDKRRERRRLTEALEQVRDESKKRKLRDDRHDSEAMEEDQLPKDIAEPQSASGKYWKSEYDIYRANTQREVKKLINKQQSAKSFARMKDQQCTELADQLREEQKKVETLEMKTAQLSTLVESLRKELQVSREVKKYDYQSSSVLDITDDRPHAAPRRAEGLRKPHEEGVKLPPQPRPLPPRPHEDPISPHLNYAASHDISALAQTLPMEATSKANGIEDIWAHALDSSNVATSKRVETRPFSHSHPAQEHRSAKPNPLKALDLNAVSGGAEGDARDSGRTAKPGRGPHLTENLHESYVNLASLQLSQRMPDEVSAALAEMPSFKSRDLQLGAESGLHMDNYARPSSSDRINNEGPSNSTIFRSSKPSATLRTAAPQNTKENEPPKPDSLAPMEASMKPSDVWNSMNASQEAKQRNVSLTGKDGREVSADRIEAARARIAARARGASAT